MERTELPVAVFDSGLGGISVLRALVQRMPGEDFLYFGDSANAPYGVRPAAEVRELTQSVIARLYARGIKAAVIACNTATSAAIGTLRAAFSDIPVIGIGAGSDVDGQVLVVTDMLGMNNGFHPKFLRRYADLHTVMTDAVGQYIRDVKDGDFPNENEHY